jgi:addiction module HigA family antidote
MTIARTGSPNWKVHPGEILKEEFLGPLKMSPYQLAKELHVPAPRINDIVLQRRSITPETAVLLARFFNTSEQFWLNLQGAYDVNLAKAENKSKLSQVKPIAVGALQGR